MSSTDFELIEKRIRLALPRPEIESALDDDYAAAGIITETLPDAFIGSRLFNVATASMAVLRNEPGEALIGREIVVPSAANSLSRFVCTILNDSIVHPGPRFNDVYFASPPTTPADMSGNVELEFAESVGVFGDQGLEGRADLLVNPDGSPVLLRKEIGGSDTYLGFKKININNVRFPGGSFYTAKVELMEPSIEVDNVTVRRAHQQSIVDIAPLRFGAFSFSPDVRDATLEPPKIEDSLAMRNPEIHRSMTLADISSCLPDRATLKAAYAELG